MNAKRKTKSRYPGLVFCGTAGCGSWGFRDGANLNLKIVNQKISEGEQVGHSQHNPSAHYGGKIDRSRKHLRHVGTPMGKRKRG